MMRNKSHSDQSADKKDRLPSQRNSTELLSASLAATVRHARSDPQSMSAQQVLQLQSTIGNRAVTHILRGAASSVSRQHSGAHIQREVDVAEVTPEQEEFNREHGATKRADEETAGATAVSRMGAPGARGTAELQANFWGYTIPESISPALTATVAAGTWTASATNLTGNYSVTTRLLPGVSEVTGPGGNTTAANYAAQVRDLRALSPNWGSWFMLRAIADHENVHAAKMAPSLSDAEAAINALFAALTVPDGGAVNSAATAVAAIQATPAYATALTNAYNLWRARYFVRIAGDHNGTAGPSYDAERAVVNPMITRINNHATAPAQNWGPAA
jgi:hypothetical protein